MVAIDLSEPISQAAFGALVGVSQQAISDFIQTTGLAQPVTAGAMLLAYCERLREQAAGRLGVIVGGLDLTQERALLAREQRIAQAIKNAVSRGEFAPVGVLADVLAEVSSAVVDRLDQLEGMLSKACPDLPDEALAVIQTLIAGARNEWIRGTEARALERLERLTQDGDDAGDDDGEPVDANAG